MSFDHATWDEIERLWKAGEEPLAQVARRFGTTHQAITARARRELWQRAAVRGEATPRQAGSEPSQNPVQASATRGKREAPTKTSRDQTRRAMVERLFKAMDTKLSAIEERIATGGDASPADSERTTRALNTLVRSLEKLTDYEGKIGKSAGRKHDKRRSAPDDPERRRQQLARRIERLLARR